ncbi:hypothetical protein [Streptomyces sp. NPDC048172]|uniref:hypothetical protein n=1 Tax=Streptomyces sp. NPDC048172 TaxID=3365505 RepID=UPI003710AC63
MTPAPTLSEEAVREAVDRVRRVPDAHRRFGKDAAFAYEQWAIDGPLLETLLDAGLPHRRAGGARTYERTDLHNLSLYLRLPSPYFTALSRTAHALDERAARGGDHHREITVAAECPGPPHPGRDCAFAPDPGFATAVVPGSLRETRPGVFDAHVRMPSDTTLFGAEQAALLALVADWELYVLPEGLAQDEGFTRETGLCNCVIPTAVLLREAEARGLTARHGGGMLITPPFTTLHHWAELPVDGAWVPADPVLLRAFARWGMADPAAWPPHRSVNGCVRRTRTWPDMVFPVVLHEGETAPTQIRAR